ncbi:MAG: hypothetical protein V4548_01475 [Bacteroidota bacterium]
MKQIYFILLVLIVFSCKDKEKPKLNDVKISKTKFEFNRIKFSDIKKIEEENNGIQFTKPINITLSKDYFPEIDKYEFEQPKIFVRDTLNMETTVSYFFTKKDSVVRLIEYSWNQGRKKGRKKEPFIDDLYNFNKVEISKSLKQSGEEKSEKVDYWWQKIIRWDNDSTHIYSFIFGMEKGQRTRVIIRYK